MLHPIRSYDLNEVFFRYDGEDKSCLFITEAAAARFKAKLKKERRKYLGRRKVRLFETRESQID